jgi:hypothetical protein
MTTSLLSNNESNSNDDIKCLELFHLIWLDDDNSENNQNIEAKLRSTITQFTKFQDVTPCRQYIENISADNRLVLLLSNHLSNELLPVIHKLQQVSLICIYDVNGITNEQLLEQFHKVE